mgnify:CR=1 FL=1
MNTPLPTFLTGLKQRLAEYQALSLIQGKDNAIFKDIHADLEKLSDHIANPSTVYQAHEKPNDRKTFESWFLDCYHDKKISPETELLYSITKDELTGEYDSPITQTAWQTWIASKIVNCQTL